MLMHRCVGTAPSVSARKGSAWIGRRACIYVDGPCWQGHGRFNRLLEAHVGVLTCVCPWERACTHGCVRVRLWPVYASACALAWAHVHVLCEITRACVFVRRERTRSGFEEAAALQELYVPQYLAMPRLHCVISAVSSRCAQGSSLGSCARAATSPPATAQAERCGRRF